MTNYLTSRMKRFIFIVILSISTKGLATTLFTDSFESGDLSKSQNGFKWGWSQRASVSNDIAHSGNYSLKFNYQALDDPDLIAPNNSWAEQRFDLGAAYPEVWLQFYVYYPDGTEGLGAAYTQRYKSPSNNKFFRLWGAEPRVDNHNATVIAGASTWPSGTDSTNGSNLGVEHSRKLCDGTVLWGMGQVDVPSVKNVITPENLGKWIKVKFHLKVASPANNDRVIQMWVDDVLLTDRQDLKGYPGPDCVNAYTAGYLMGWANTGFVDETHIYIDDVEITYGPGPIQSPPEPPTIN